jgi:hypothetical protein
MKTQDTERFDQEGIVVYRIPGKIYSIEKTTFGKFLRDYYSDKTTSPRGVEPRCFVDTINRDEDQGKWGIYEWSTSSHNPKLLHVCDSEEEAEAALMGYWEDDYVSNGGDQNFYESVEAYVEDLDFGYDVDAIRPLLAESIEAKIEVERVIRDLEWARLEIKRLEKELKKAQAGK